MLKRFQGKHLLLITALLLVVYTVFSIQTAGNYIGALDLVMKPTAHLAFIFFFLAFTTSSLHIMRPSDYSRWAMKNRRYLGLNFALIHFVHLGFVLSNLAFTEETREASTLGIGALAYLFLFLMTITSNNTAVRKLGARKWKMLHKISSYYIWFIFLATSSKEPEAFTSFSTSWLPLMCILAILIRYQGWKMLQAKAKNR
ncbi:hypothetical protein [Kordiimonas laminariae]|uniref:hypothetical protein n=1 Tax=Kordiimonas laminariae TaxID=2917717 RepID=UPI001FF6CA88|nr:hypothetical protein [Kordiimonas laminariae]MCK0069022.1 hypothetical protein [Kordiimonas laminariae]